MTYFAHCFIYVPYGNTGKFYCEAQKSFIAGSKSAATTKAKRWFSNAFIDFVDVERDENGAYPNIEHFTFWDIPLRRNHDQ